MTRTAPLLLALLVGCTTTETPPMMMYNHSTMRPRPMSGQLAHNPRQSQEPPASGNLPSMRVRPGTPYAMHEGEPARPAPGRPDAALAQSRNAPGYEEAEDEERPAPMTVRRGRPVPPDDAEEEDEEAAPRPKSRKRTATVSVGPVPDRLPQFPAGEEPSPVPEQSVRLVNSRRIQLSYKIQDGDDVGVSQADVWYTHGGGRWQRYGTARKTPYVVEVPGEGVYGFRMLASVEGMPGVTPQPDERPDVSVEVDTTKPEVRILAAKPGAEGKLRTVHVQWSAADKNLKDGTISVSYAREASGPWLPVVSGMDNGGQYAWKVPSGVPQRIYLKVEAEDWAGNVGGSVTAKPVVFESPRPPVMIEAVEAAAHAAPAVPVLRLQPEN
jgi:hypothetical protein